MLLVPSWMAFWFVSVVPICLKSFKESVPVFSCILISRHDNILNTTSYLNNLYWYHYIRRVYQCQIIICFQCWNRFVTTTVLNMIARWQQLKQHPRIPTSINREQKKPFLHCNKCLTYGGDYVETLWDNSTVKSELLLLQLRIKNPKYVHCKLILWPILLFKP